MEVQNYTTTIRQQMRSEDEYNAFYAAAEAVTNTMWSVLIIAIVLKVFLKIHLEAIFAMIAFSQVIVQFKFIGSVVLPAPSELTFEIFNMMVNFSPNQYPAIE